MSKSATSVFVFALYLLVIGVVLVVIPNMFLAVFGQPETGEVWIRVLGAVVAILGFYYLQAARNDLTAFFRATVFGRCAALVFFTAFVVLGFAPPILILFGAIDAMGGLWTAMSLKADQTA
jgi:hypothetical protein